MESSRPSISDNHRENSGLTSITQSREMPLEEELKKTSIRELTSGVAAEPGAFAATKPPGPPTDGDPTGGAGAPAPITCPAPGRLDGPPGADVADGAGAVD